MAFLKNDAEGNEFKVILWRTTQKNEATPQITTQKNDNATQKDIDATQKKVLDYFKQHPKGTRIEAAEAIVTSIGSAFLYMYFYFSFLPLFLLLLLPQKHPHTS